MAPQMLPESSPFDLERAQPEKSAGNVSEWRWCVFACGTVLMAFALFASGFAAHYAVESRSDSPRPSIGGLFWSKGDDDHSGADSTFLPFPSSWPSKANARTARDVDEIRRKMVATSIQFNLGASNLTLSGTPFQDYTSITKIFEEAHDLVGVDGLVSPDGLFGIVPWRRDLTAEAAKRQIHIQWKIPNLEEGLYGIGPDGVNRDDIKKSSFNSIRIAQADGGFDIAPNGKYCDGCMEEMYHYLGAWLMERILLMRPVYKYGVARPESVLRTIEDLAGELIRQIHLPDQSFGPNMALHGASWQLIAADVAVGRLGVGGWLEEYPLELVERLCGKERVYGSDPLGGYDVAWECKHAIGHGVFNSIVFSQLQRFPHTEQKIGRGMFTMEDKYVQLGHKVCNTAPKTISPEEFERLGVAKQCVDGFGHSYRLASGKCDETEAGYC